MKLAYANQRAFDVWLVFFFCEYLRGTKPFFGERRQTGDIFTTQTCKCQ